MAEGLVGLGTPGTRLSIVVACADGAPSPAASLRALREACNGVGCAIILAHDPRHEVARNGHAAFPGTTLARGREDASVPELWATGALVADGDVIAFTIPECVVGPHWPRALLEAIQAGATGAGGGFALSQDASLVTRAVYFLRYSAFLPRAGAETGVEIAGDNAAYSADALRRHRDALTRGFWEVEFHHLIRAEGATLAMVPEATATFHGPIRFTAIWRQRLAHGRHFGAWRVRELGESPWRIWAAAPLVPAVLVVRILRRLRGHPGLRARALPALPVILALALAWACGEALGALGAGAGDA